MTQRNRGQEDFAKAILNNSQLEGVRERIQTRLFNKFRSVPLDQREIISYIMDNENLFFKELRIIAGEAEIADEIEAEEKAAREAEEKPE